MTGHCFFSSVSTTTSSTPRCREPFVRWLREGEMQDADEGSFNHQDDLLTRMARTVGISKYDCVANSVRMSTLRTHDT